VAHYDHLGVRSGSVHPGPTTTPAPWRCCWPWRRPRRAWPPAPPPRGPAVLRRGGTSQRPTDRMGSAWFWRHPPFPLTTLHCALVFDLLAGPATPGARDAGLADVIFVLGAEASPGLARWPAVSAGNQRGTGAPRLPLIEAVPVYPLATASPRRLSRPAGTGPPPLPVGHRRPRFHLSHRRGHARHPGYAKLARVTVGSPACWCTPPRTRATSAGPTWSPTPGGRARHPSLHASTGNGSQFPWLLRRALAADRARVQALLTPGRPAPRPPPRSTGSSPSSPCACRPPLWHPAGWWFALW